MADNNAKFSRAKNTQNDEFYTQLTDVSKGMKNYKKFFKNKIILCNCDNPRHSAFWKYFHLNFEALGLKNSCPHIITKSKQLIKWNIQVVMIMI